MASTIKLKRGSGVPSGGSLAAGEPALDLTNNKLYSSTDGTDVVEISPQATLTGLGVTASAAELNTLDGITATTAELNVLDGITATVSELNILDGVTATTTELNYVDGVTSNIQTQIDALPSVLSDFGVTATATELNYTDGVTSNIQTQLNSKISNLAGLGITATAAEINTLDGITATTTELNYTDGVTSAIQTQLNTKATTASPQFSGVSLFNTGSQPAAGVNGVSIDGTANPRMKMGFASNLGVFFEFYGSSAAVGSISTTGGSTTYSTTSDYRVKENIIEMTGAVDRVNNLNPVRFNFIGEQNIVDGFLAHEVQLIVPEAIVGEKDAVDAEGNPAYQGIDQAKLVPLLVAAVQELSARLNQLENN